MLGDRGQAVVPREECVVVEEEQEVSVNDRGSRVAPRRDAEIALQEDGPHPSGQTLGLPAVADDHDVHLDVPLAQHGADRLVQLLRALPHGEDNNPVAREDADLRGSSGGHRSLLEVRMARTWPRTVTTAAASNPATRRRVAVRPVPSIVSATAATSARSVSSMEW